MDRGRLVFVLLAFAWGADAIAWSTDTCNIRDFGAAAGGDVVCTKAIQSAVDQCITIANCVICSPPYSRVIYGRQRGLAGLALEIVDGGTLERVSINNISMTGVTVPIFMRLGNRARIYEDGQPQPDVGRFRHVMISPVTASDCSKIGCSMTGLPGHRIEDVILRDIVLNFEGGGTREDATREIPEKPAGYPESTMFGTLPAYGFFCRHVTGLQMHNVKLGTTAPDLRHALVLDDVEDSVLSSIHAPFVKGAAGMVSLLNARGITIRDCHAPQNTALFLDLNGQQTADVSMYNNDFRGVQQVCQCDAEVPESVLTL